jgi:hypothetical protein
MKGRLTLMPDKTLAGTIKDRWGYEFAVTLTRELEIDVRLVGVPDALWIEGDEVMGFTKETGAKSVV